MSKIIIDLPDDSYFVKLELDRINSLTGERIDFAPVFCAVVPGDSVTIKPFSDARIQR